MIDRARTVHYSIHVWQCKCESKATRWSCRSFYSKFLNYKEIVIVVLLCHNIIYSFFMCLRSRLHLVWSLRFSTVVLSDQIYTIMLQGDRNWAQSDVTKKKTKRRKIMHLSISVMMIIFTVRREMALHKRRHDKRTKSVCSRLISCNIVIVLWSSVVHVFTSKLDSDSDRKKEEALRKLIVVGARSTWVDRFDLPTGIPCVLLQDSLLFSIVERGICVWVRER